ncbi:hypothetical protein LXL04_012910 [Taraxacum kok-saghyz]
MIALLVVLRLLRKLRSLQVLRAGRVRRRGGGDGVTYTNPSSSYGPPRVADRVRSLSFRGLPFPDATGKVGYNLTS